MSGPNSKQKSAHLAAMQRIEKESECAYATMMANMETRCKTFLRSIKQDEAERDARRVRLLLDTRPKWKRLGLAKPKRKSKTPPKTKEEKAERARQLYQQRKLAKRAKLT